MLDDAAELVGVMRKKSVDELISMAGISQALAELNFERWQEWSVPFERGQSTASSVPAVRPAVLTFMGDVYRGLDAAASFDERDYTHAQKVLRILSGLYGVLRPLDLMAAYRLEMGSGLATDRGRDLYEFWGGRITEALNEDLAESPGPDVFVNLASKEYFAAVDAGALAGKVVTPVFLDGRLGDDGAPVREPRVMGYFTKEARGAMAGWIVRERVKSVRALRGFDGLGYSYDPDRSSSDRPVFVRWS